MIFLLEINFKYTKTFWWDATTIHFSFFFNNIFFGLIAVLVPQVSQLCDFDPSSFNCAILTPQVSQLCDFSPPSFNCAILAPQVYPLLHLVSPSLTFFD
jgi:hypothetical protein